MQPKDPLWNSSYNPPLIVEGRKPVSLTRIMGSFNLEQQDKGLTKLKNFYDGARGLLKQYLQKEQGVSALGSRSYPGDSAATNGGKITPIEGIDRNDSEFMDISYSDLGGIVNPKSFKHSRNNTNTSLNVQSIEVADDKGSAQSDNGSKSQTRSESSSSELNFSDGDCDDTSTNVDSCSPASVPTLDSENINNFDKKPLNSKPEIKSMNMNDLHLEEIT